MLDPSVLDVVVPVVLVLSLQRDMDIDCNVEDDVVDNDDTDWAWHDTGTVLAEISCSMDLGPPLFSRWSMAEDRKSIWVSMPKRMMVLDRVGDKSKGKLLLWYQTLLALQSILLSWIWTKTRSFLSANEYTGSTSDAQQLDTLIELGTTKCFCSAIVK